MASSGQDRGIYLKPSSVSVHSKAEDITEQPIFRGDGELDEADLNECYSLEDLVHGMEGNHPKPEQGDSRYNEKMAKWALDAFFTNQKLKVHVVVDEEVPGLSHLHPLQNSSRRRADVAVYDDKTKTQVLLLVEVQSSPMRETVIKSIHGAADILRLVRNNDVNFKEFIVFAFPKWGEKKCAVKITVIWENLHFTYHLQVLTTASQLWGEIGRAVENQQVKVPSLPNPDSVKPDFLMPLSSYDLGQFGPSARQLQSVYHIMIDDGSNVHKLVTQSSEMVSLRDLRIEVLERGLKPRHFIVPAMGAIEDVFKYPKVFYGPLNRVKARQCLRTLVMKIDEALTELHGIGLAHTDIRLPNICFNRAYDAILIDMDRCVFWNNYPALATSLAGKSCMYKRPETIEKEHFNGKHLDYLQLGWLVAWVLSEDSEYHTREWKMQNQCITNDKFVSTLVCYGTYDPSALDTSDVVIDTDSFANVFQ